jgi:hypothetical protein
LLWPGICAIFAVALFIITKRFTMKKWILAAILIFALSGYAAAQSTPVKAASKIEEKKTVKKGPAIKSGTANKPEIKKESEAPLVKLELPKLVADTTAFPPKGKNDQ